MDTCIGYYESINVPTKYQVYIMHASMKIHYIR